MGQARPAEDKSSQKVSGSLSKEVKPGIQRPFAQGVPSLPYIGLNGDHHWYTTFLRSYIKILT